MSDDEAPPPAAEEEPTLDERGFHIVRTGGKLQNQLNPLQLKMERERKEKEEKAKKDAKKAALDKRLAAFGGNKSAEGETRAEGVAGARLGERGRGARCSPAVEAAAALGARTSALGPPPLSHRPASPPRSCPP
jgi:hypothetical protein